MYRDGYAERVRNFVAARGTYVTTYWSGEADTSGLCFTDRHPLSDVLGIRTEEIEVSPEYVKNGISYRGRKYDISGICALVHAETAEILGTYEKDFYAGYPALTVHSYGKGKAYYIAAQADFLSDFYRTLAEETGCGCALALDGELPGGVTVNERAADAVLGGSERSLWFVQNFLPGETKIVLAKVYRDAETGERVEGEIRLAGYQCLVLEENA